MYFKGQFEQTLDDKGRLNIPRPMRAQLESVKADTLIVTSTTQCLEIIPEKDWQVFLRKFERLPQMRQDVRQFRRFYIAPAQDVTMDKQGRILIPQTLRKRVGLDRDIVIAGNFDKIEVYAADTWKKVEEEDRASFDENAEKLSEEIS